MESDKISGKGIAFVSILTIIVCIFIASICITISKDTDDNTSGNLNLEGEWREYDWGYTITVRTNEIPNIGTEFKSRQLYGGYVVERTIADYSAVAVSTDKVIFVTSDGKAEIYDKSVDFGMAAEFDCWNEAKEEYEVCSYQEIEGAVLNSIFVNQINYGNEIYYKETDEKKSPKVNLYLSHEDEILKNITVVYTVSK